MVFAKVWKSFVRILIYILTPIVLAYIACVVVASCTTNGLLWGCINIPTNLYDICGKVTAIGTLPAVVGAVYILIKLGGIAFQNNTQTTKNSLNIAILEEKANLELQNQIVLLKNQKVLVENTMTISDEEKAQVIEEINNTIAKIERHLSTTIDFDKLDVQTIKTQLLALKEMSKGITSLISSNK